MRDPVAHRVLDAFDTWVGWGCEPGQPDVTTELAVLAERLQRCRAQLGERAVASPYQSFLVRLQPRPEAQALRA